MEHGFQELRVQRPDVVLKVSDELTFVPAFVGNDVAGLIGPEIVHDKLPFAAKIAVAERHFRIERGRVRNQQFHALFVMDLADTELRPVEVRVFV